jgi:hypothetical protein
MRHDSRRTVKPFHTSKRYGTGLGLVIVKKMLSTMNSTIKVQSEKKKGATIMIFIPEDTKSCMTPQIIYLKPMRMMMISNLLPIRMRGLKPYRNKESAQHSRYQRIFGKIQKD